MQDTVMYVEYSRSVIWLNLNTYSLFSPFATLPGKAAKPPCCWKGKREVLKMHTSILPFAISVLIMLTYHVRNHMRLKDGDYFGLQAVFAILITLLVHDA